MNPADRFRINSPSVAAEVIGGEAVMINLDTGSYYGTDRVGGVICEWIGNGFSVGEILRLLAERYDGPADEVESATCRFLRDLAAEGLIAPADTAAPAPAAAAPLPGAREPFTAPTIERFDDMKDLLLSDPIHDVDESGWPNRAKPS